MPIAYENVEVLHAETFADFANWHHEGIGEIGRGPDDGRNGGGMRLHCKDSRQGGKGCMAFFRPHLPDQVAFEYELTIRSQGGLLINYLALRGLQGEDLIADRERLPKRTGVMRDYFSAKWGLQSYHVSFSRFDDEGKHTGTSNWRRNPGMLLVGHGTDPVQEIGRKYRIRVTKDKGHCQMYVDGRFAHAMLDRDAGELPIPDAGKFGFRLIGSDVQADIEAFHVYRITTTEKIWRKAE